MKAAWVRAERESEVRLAGRSWRDAGAIGDAALVSIEELYTAPWPNPSLTWRVLGFFFVSFAAVALYGAIAVTTRELAVTGFLLVPVLALVADRLRVSTSGAAAASGAACGFWAVVCLLVAIADAAHWRESAVTLLFASAAAAFAAGAWRWGYPSFAVLAAAFFFLLLARSASGRLLWLLAGAALVALCAPLLDRAAMAPSHRKSAAAILAVALIAVYVSVNRYCLDREVIESVANAHGKPAGSAVRILASLATAVFPLLILGWGLRARRTLLVDLGVIFIALSFATLRYYVHLAPLWLILTAAGGAMIGSALAVHRVLTRSPEGRRRGFTADALYQDESKQETLGMVGALALTPAARTPAPAEAGAFRGGGGSSGGAGSSGSF